MNINPELIRLAQWRIEQDMNGEKLAFVPPGAGGEGGAPPADPAAGGAPPMDPSMMGGAPPMDPAAMGGAPPMDPSMMGGGPVPGGGGLTADSIAQIVSQTMQQQMGGAGAAGGGGAAGAMGKPAKPDINTVAIDIFQVKKMLQYLFQTMGIPLPPDILDGPNRNPSTGTPMPPGAPGSTSDPAVTAAAGGGGAPPGGGGGAQGGAIPPIDPMQAGGPGVGGEKMGNDFYMGRPHEGAFDVSAISKASALAAVYRRLKGE